LLARRLSRKLKQFGTDFNRIASTVTILRMQRLKIVVLLASTGLMIACTEGKPPQSQSWSVATGAEAYERLWWKSIQQRDFKSVEWHVAPIYTLTTPSGIQDRDGAMKYFEGLDLARADIAELEVKPEGSDMVVSYMATLQTRSSAAPQRYYMTTIWQEGKKGWMAIAHSETLADSNLPSVSHN
jgi:hypothetical protein